MVERLNFPPESLVLLGILRVLVAAFDRLARPVKHFLTVVDERNDLGIGFVSACENIDISGAMGCLFVTIIGCIAKFEWSLIIERIQTRMRWRRLEGLPLGRAPLAIEREALGLGPVDKYSDHCYVCQNLGDCELAGPPGSSRDVHG